MAVILGPTRRVVEFMDNLWEVKFEVDDEVDPVLTSVRVLDDQYRPTGPNLISVLDKCYVPAECGTEALAFLHSINELVKQAMI